jgi:rod shape-determining protein MreC
LYGLIQDKVVAGIAEIRNNQLYAYLTSDRKCRFSVFIGSENAPGIATGSNTNEMIIKFIPKWHQVNIGDKVTTSGLDNIFFANIPVGQVTKIEMQSAYKIAHIKTYNDTYHPKTFFLINNAQVTIANDFDSNATRLTPFKVIKVINNEQNLTKTIENEQNQTTPLISSIPSRVDQTQEEVIEPEIPLEKNETIKPKKKKRKKKRKKKASSLDLF